MLIERNCELLKKTKKNDILGKQMKQEKSPRHRNRKIFKCCYNILILQHGSKG